MLVFNTSRPTPFYNLHPPVIGLCPRRHRCDLDRDRGDDWTLFIIVVILLLLIVIILFLIHVS